MEVLDGWEWTRVPEYRRRATMSNRMTDGEGGFGWVDGDLGPVGSVKPLVVFATAEDYPPNAAIYANREGLVALRDAINAVLSCGVMPNLVVTQNRVEGRIGIVLSDHDDFDMGVRENAARGVR